MACNVFTLVAALKPEDFKFGAIKVHGVVLAVILLYVNYRRYTRDARVDRMIDEMLKQSTREARWEELKLFIGLFASLVAPVVVLAVRKWLHAR